MSICKEAAACFPSTVCVGVDLLVGLDGSFRVAEVNAFGDLLPGIVDRGQDTYDAQIEAYHEILAAQRRCQARAGRSPQGSP
jgi:hypothetical protein